MRIQANLLLVLLIAANGRASPIRHEQIPADSVGYLHFDIDRFIASGLCRAMADGADIASIMKEQLGGRIGSITIYSTRRDGTVRIVILVSGDQDFRRRIEALAGKAKDAVVIKIGEQDVHYSAGPQFLLNAVGANDRPTTNPVDVPEPPSRKWRPSFSMGFGKDGDEIQNWANGPSYLAFTGQDLIIGTADLRSMADALDVLGAKKTSLAAQDPQRIKRNPPQGAILLGAGITAYVSAQNPATDDRHAGTTQPASSASGGFDFDVFSPLRGKAQLAHFDIGEDDQSVYVNVSVGMADAESATQLKNLAIGVKALLALSQIKQQALINPLEVQAAGSDVILHWSWPVAKLKELASMITSGANAQTSSSTSIRTSTPTQPVGGAR